MVLEKFSKIVTNEASQESNTYFKQTEIGEIPQDWEIVSIGQVCDVTSGGTPSRNKPEFWNGNIPWVKTGEINYSEIRDTEEKITQEGLSNSSAKLVPRGTLLMAMYGQGVTRGKVAMLGIDAALNQACLAILQGEKIYNQFLYYCLTREYQNLRDIGNETTQKNLNASIVKQVLVPLPPIHEQKEIAEILSSVDEAIASTQAVIDQTRKVKQGLLQQLLTRGIGHTKFKHSAIGKIPESWQVVELGGITTDSAFDPRFSGDLYDPNGNYGSVRTTDINENWEINYETVPRAMLPEAQCENHRLIDGDLLVTRSGSCGIVCVFREQTIPMIPGAFLIRFRLKNYANSEFVRLAMMAPTAQSSMATMAAGGVQKNLSGTNLKKLLLPLPLLDEQDKIVSC
ncbi:restriction endonuclease subunit S [Brasilonema sp. UFV-L1]|uniref:restriction endonuclease subunit S n=1 Tax=Brasilonema sp. UFV-L1 TaxID=2234130 RepID=UPI00145F2335|nr:restriction endonuclease subunit S [Brasilonema sp. UFV-L1]NMG05875.1 hypothetical protein [Brasilonema sp. UFV-L1]